MVFMEQNIIAYNNQKIKKITCQQKYASQVLF